MGSPLISPAPSGTNATEPTRPAHRIRELTTSAAGWVGLAFSETVQVAGSRHAATSLCADT